MRHTTTILLACLLLPLAACSAGSDPAPAVTVTATASLSTAEARAACVDAWAAWFEEAPDDYDPDTDQLPELSACDGVPNQAQLGFEALQERNTAARESLEGCLEDPACTDWPVPTP